MAAAAARKLGMNVHIQLEQRVAMKDAAYRQSGNVLLDRMLGAELHSYPSGEDEGGADAQLEAIAADLRRQGRTPYVIHLALGHPPLGALGYVRAAAELLEQMREMELAFDEIAIASGSGQTHAGMLFGLRALACPVRVTGVCVRRGRATQVERINTHCQRLAETLEMPGPVEERDVILVDDFLAPGYGQLNPPAIEAIKLTARSEGILLDPVYTAKGMAGAIHRARSLRPEQKILFVHTGGVPAIFGYEPVLTDVL
jgi:D-cysteine desulfhydrase/L-cysteate sulfo-lyase